MIEIRQATTPAEVRAAEVAFDGPARPEATIRFLAEPGHHLLVAYSGEQVAGMVSGVEVTHPDKGTEMFLYELAVVERWQRHGIGRQLVEALRDLAAELGCYGMWVLTDDANEAALRTYRAAGSTAGSSHRMLDWTFPEPGG